MKRAAAGEPPDFLQRGRFDQLVPEQGDDLFHPFGGQPLLPLAEQFLLSGVTKNNSAATSSALA